MEYTAGEVAALAHVPVARLRQYAESGLVPPTGRSATGGRMFGEDALERLFLVLTYEELGLDESDIRAALRSRPTAAAHLRAQRRLLAAQRERIESLLTTLTTALEYEESGPAMTGEEKLRMLDDWQQDELRADREIHLPSQRTPGTLVRDMKS